MQRSAIATLVERKTRHPMLVAIRGGHNVGDALVDVLAGLPPALRRTLTWDRGNEMFHHERIELLSGIRIYFADPHSPWQRGTKENTNGLLRQYFPKGINFDPVDDTRIGEVADELNDRPRLCLGAGRDSSWHDRTANSSPADSRRRLETAPFPVMNRVTRPGLSCGRSTAPFSVAGRPPASP
jgi:IS30 family transposase